MKSPELKNRVVPVLACEKVVPGGCELRFKEPLIAARARPGQFVYIKPHGLRDPALRRAFSVLDADPARGTVSVYFEIKGAGTRALAGLKAGDPLSVLGPLGNGFPLDEAGPVNVLVAGGCGIAPLVFLTKTLRKMKRTVHFYYGVRSRDRLVYGDRLKHRNCRLHLSSDDGSCGSKGLVTARLRIPSGAPVFSCGPVPMLRSLACLAPDAFVALETEMACGLGVCNGCAVLMADGTYKRCCTEGPVFRASEVAWN